MISEVCLLKWHLLNNLSVNWGGHKAAFADLYHQIPLFIHSFQYFPKGLGYTLYIAEYLPQEMIELNPITVYKVKDEYMKPPFPEGC